MITTPIFCKFHMREAWWNDFSGKRKRAWKVIGWKNPHYTTSVSGLVTSEMIMLKKRLRYRVQIFTFFLTVSWPWWPWPWRKVTQTGIVWLAIVVIVVEKMPVMVFSRLSTLPSDLDLESRSPMLGCSERSFHGTQSCQLLWLQGW